MPVYSYNSYNAVRLSSDYIQFFWLVELLVLDNFYYSWRWRRDGISTHAENWWYLLRKESGEKSQTNDAVSVQ